MFFKRIAKRIAGLLDYLVWLILSPKKFKRFSKRDIRNILVINTAFLGDLLATTPLLRNLSDAGYSVDVLISREAKGLLDNNKAIRKILIFKNNKELLKQISGHYELALCIWPQEYKFLKLLKKAKIPYLIKSAQLDRPRLGSLIMTRVIPPTTLSKHKVLENLNLASPLIEKLSPGPYEIFPSGSDKLAANNILSKNKIGKFAIIHAAVRSKKSKQWPDKKFAHIIDYLIENKKLRVLLGGAKKDIQKNKDIIKHVGNKKHIENIAGKTNILGYASLISKADLVISVSTATLHIACAMKRKLIGLYSEYLDIWRPWKNDRSAALYNPQMSKITEQSVIEKIDSLI